MRSRSHTHTLAHTRGLTMIHMVFFPQTSTSSLFLASILDLKRNHISYTLSEIVCSMPLTGRSIDRPSCIVKRRGKWWFDWAERWWRELGLDGTGLNELHIAMVWRWKNGWMDVCMSHGHRDKQADRQTDSEADALSFLVSRTTQGPFVFRLLGMAIEYITWCGTAFTYFIIMSFCSSGGARFSAYILNHQTFPTRLRSFPPLGGRATSCTLGGSGTQACRQANGSVVLVVCYCMLVFVGHSKWKYRRLYLWGPCLSSYTE
ncbi:hypothetical protein B0T17DRAFT_367393 [Bombardia bombarda]|uniref:Uncharacterized protein n=1 Tax=Bombardia bombarda TaxID=252184 RepID=A0AA40BWD7_9PEZI|nr:hypothetical protein B0T17DRAFT_367393 [Bombardia bombarda]